MQQAARPDITQATTRLHVKVGILCALAVMMDGFDAQAIGFVAPSLLAEWHITRVAGHFQNNLKGRRPRMP